MSKHFIISPAKEELSKESILSIQSFNEQRARQSTELQVERNKEVISQSVSLKKVPGRIIVKINMEEKNFHVFRSGLKIRRERKFNEFNRRITQPINAYVVSGEGVEEGAEILISHNATHDVNRIFDYEGEKQDSDIRYFSLPEEDCFAWKNEEGEWVPVRGYTFGYRVFKPYVGIMQNIPPTQVRDVLYITTGEFKGNVVHTLNASDYCIVYQDTDGQENYIIRCRHYEEDNVREEIIAINHELTEKVQNQELLIGIEISDAKPLEISSYAD